MISLDDSPGCGPRGAGPPGPNSDASHCGTNALQKSSTSQKTSTIRSNIIASVTESAFEKSGRVQSLSIGVNGAVEHQADHGQGDHRFGDLWQLFVILGEAPPSSEPAKCSFDHPPARQGNKAGGPCDRSHNDQGQAEQETGQEDSGAVVDTVSEHHLEPAVEWLDFAQKI